MADRKGELFLAAAALGRALQRARDAPRAVEGKTPGSRSSARLVSVTRCDHRSAEVRELDLATSIASFLPGQAVAFDGLPAVRSALSHCRTSSLSKG